MSYNPPLNVDFNPLSGSGVTLPTHQFQSLIWEISLVANYQLFVRTEC